jgi:hypothetical protein
MGAVQRLNVGGSLWGLRYSLSLPRGSSGTTGDCSRETCNASMSIALKVAKCLVI